MLGILLICIGMNGVTQLPSNIHGGLNTLNSPCYLNWRQDKELMADEDYTPMLFRLGKNSSQLTNMYKDKLWLVWNEPERVDQANTTPQVAANLTISYTKGITNGVTWACCGIMLGNEGYTWLDTYLSYGGPIPTYWNIHIYDITLDGWKLQLDRWWKWWDIHGEGKKVIIGETSLMYASTYEQTKLVNYLMDLQDDRIVRIYWFSAVSEPTLLNWDTGILMDDNGELTDLGYLLTNQSPTSDNVIIEPTKLYKIYLPIERLY